MSGAGKKISLLDQALTLAMGWIIYPTDVLSKDEVLDFFALLIGAIASSAGEIDVPYDERTCAFHGALLSPPSPLEIRSSVEVLLRRLDALSASWTGPLVDCERDCGQIMAVLKKHDEDLLSETLAVLAEVRRVYR